VTRNRRVSTPAVRSVRFLVLLIAGGGLVSGRGEHPARGPIPTTVPPLDVIAEITHAPGHMLVTDVLVLVAR